MLKQFFSLLKRYILPYRKYLTWALILNFLSQWLNVFSFMAIVPILNILFKIDTKSYEYIPMDIHNLDKDVLINNAYYLSLIHILLTNLCRSRFGYNSCSAVRVKSVPHQSGRPALVWFRAWCLFRKSLVEHGCRIVVFHSPGFLPISHGHPAKQRLYFQTRVVCVLLAWIAGWPSPRIPQSDLQALCCVVWNSQVSHLSLIHI